MSIPEGVYRIINSRLGCAAVVLPQQNVLRGEVGKEMNWNVRSVDQEQGLYTFESVDFGGYLGVNSVDENQAVYRLDDSEAQQWRVVPHMNGVSISQTSESGTNVYYWYLGAVGEPVIISGRSKGATQPWMFERIAEE